MSQLNMTTRRLKEIQAINWAAVARRHHLDPTTIYHTLAGRKRGPRTRRLICDILGCRPEAIWPEKKAS
ncbi:MAG: helix-turn-helix transcriptional regulator [Elusimicrobiota bacterium]